MALEIEHKYLVTDESFKPMAISDELIVQAYLSRRVESTVRVRIKGERAFLTIKGANSGAVRHEWEYEIPVADAREMVELADGPTVEKRRYVVPYGGLSWEVDEFLGRLAGLTVAEVEVPSVDTPVALPPFVGQEVTGDPRYYNSAL